ncbi:hypothetical protein GCK72_024150 [Caenorhabditis remanei]|uniref:Uncharacterized protein n=1 Tax=Caenorhabditis remanei TaxID=31234 RepID=A0A6A5FZ17_CAERE|nr:hypothetical protein GCK72_024150 [Caenorhabditis remanei]KAF1747684.1 hypothetical protein GCK72_024150 [Caenorhabditis remanei]
MLSERSQNGTQIVPNFSPINLLEETVNRKYQLEKILFAYHNLHRLSKRFSMVAHTAFHSKDPLVLWNYENDMILKDSEVDELMNGDCMQYKNYDDQSGGQYQKHYNGSNLVNTLDAPCQPLPFPPDFSLPPPPLGQPMHPGSFIPTPETCTPPQFVCQEMPPPPSFPPPIMGLPMPSECIQPGQQCPIFTESPPNFMEPPPMVPIAPFPLVTPPPPPPQYQAHCYPNPVFNQNDAPCVPSLGIFAPPPGYVAASYMPPNYSQPPPEVIDPNHPDIVYDMNGFAFRRVVITTTCLVPIAQCSTSTDSGYSGTSEQCDFGGSVSTDCVVEEYDGNCTIEVCCENSQEYIATCYADSEDPTLVTEQIDPEANIKIDSSSTPSESTLTAAEIVEQDSSEEQVMQIPKIAMDVYDVVDCPETRVVDEKQCCSSTETIDNVIDQVASTIEEIAPLAEEIAVDENATKTTSATSSSRVKKLTRKEKRLRQEQKKREMETDDVILERAIKQKRDLLAEAEKAEKAEKEAAEAAELLAKSNKNKKSKINNKVIVEKVSVAPPPPPKVNPQILHAVRMAIDVRSKQVMQAGRPIIHDDPLTTEFFIRIKVFERSVNPDSSDSLSLVKKFIQERIDAFKQMPPPQSMSRITIYEQLFVHLPPNLIIELLFLNYLLAEKNELFRKFEEAFINLF